jgi:hypothetical protein
MKVLPLFEETDAKLKSKSKFVLLQILLLTKMSRKKINLGLPWFENGFKEIY